MHSRVTTVVVKHLDCMRGFAVHLGTQMPVCCAFNAQIEKSNEAVLFEFVCELYGRYDVDVALEPVKAAFFDDGERVIHMAGPKFGYVSTCHACCTK